MIVNKPPGYRRTPHWNVPFQATTGVLSRYTECLLLLLCILQMIDSVLDAL